jgi:hypothetical protein
MQTKVGVLSIPMTEEGASKNQCQVTVEATKVAALPRGMTRMRQHGLRNAETCKQSGLPKSRYRLRPPGNAISRTRCRRPVITGPGTGNPQGAGKVLRSASLRNLVITILRLSGVASIAAGLRYHARQPSRPLQTMVKC